MSPPRNARSAKGDGRRWRLRLYIAGHSPKSVAALANLRRLCDTHLPGRCDIEVVDLAREPALAKRDDIIVIPTLVRRMPPPLRRIVGDLSNAERVLLGLDVS